MKGPASPPCRPQQQVRGFYWVMLTFFLFSLCDVMTKQISTSYHPVQVAWARQAGLFVGALGLLWAGGLSTLHSRRPGLQILRGATSIVSTVFFVAALRYLPLADATAVTFVAPLLITALAPFLLKEQVSPARWCAVGIGLVGTLIVLRPGVGDDVVRRFAEHRCRCPGGRRWLRVSPKYSRRAGRFVVFLQRKGVARLPRLVGPDPAAKSCSALMGSCPSSGPRSSARAKAIQPRAPQHVSGSCLSCRIRSRGGPDTRRPHKVPVKNNLGKRAFWGVFAPVTDRHCADAI